LVEMVRRDFASDYRYVHDKELTSPPHPTNVSSIEKRFASDPARTYMP